MELRRKPDVLDRTRYSNSKLYRLINDGLFTAPIRDGAVAYWPDHEIELLTRAKIAGKTEEETRQLVADLLEQRETALEDYREVACA